MEKTSPAVRLPPLTVAEGQPARGEIQDEGDADQMAGRLLPLEISRLIRARHQEVEAPVAGRDRLGGPLRRGVKWAGRNKFLGR